MEEQNKITPWKFIMQHWKLILLVFLFPIIINGLTFIPNFHVFDKPNSWTEVWAEYGGALLSAGIALVILYKQQEQNQKVNEEILKQNHEENEANRKNNEKQNSENREYQKMSLIYQRKCDWLKELRKALTNLYIAQNLGEILNLQGRILTYYTKEYTVDEDYNQEFLNIKKDLFVIYNNIKKAYSTFGFLFEDQENLDEEERKIICKINDIECCFINYINEIKWMIYNLPPTYKKQDLQKIKKTYESFFKYDGIVDGIVFKVLDKYDFNMKEKAIEILYEMYHLLHENIAPVIEKYTCQLLKYEQQKIDKSLDKEDYK